MTIDIDKIGGALKHVFPHGTGDHELFGYREMPAWPTDVFAFAAYLIERGGVYHRIKRVRDEAEKRKIAADNKRLLPVTDEKDTGDIDKWRALGEKWRTLPSDITNAIKLGQVDKADGFRRDLQEAITGIQNYWKALVGCHTEDVVNYERMPKWALHAYALLIIADEAARGLGYEEADPTGEHPLETIVRDSWARDDAKKPDQIIDSATSPSDHRATHVLLEYELTTYAISADPNVVRVLPKSHTPAVGNTMRTLTHNLTLVPPLGAVEMAWQRELRTIEDDRTPLNLLLVPFPFKIAAKCFKPDRSARRHDLNHDQWSCTFHLHQRWLMKDGKKPDPDKDAADAEKTRSDRTRRESREILINFLCDLLEQARADVRRIHGLVLPELALDWLTYKHLVWKLLDDAVRDENNRKRLPDFVICGSSSDFRERVGNHVFVTVFTEDEKRSLIATTHSRAKHHRWRLTGSQIADYGLSASLDPQIAWWEEAEIPQRQVGLTVFRRNSIFSAMICEDLARSEPCHEPLKNIGPNLIFTLLMDGSQLPDRWSARYATSLADDPGSAVLTLTSLGLIERTNAQGRHNPTTRNIALWKDSSGRMVPISCPSGAQAVLLTLGGEVAVERTFDGRENKDTTNWRYQGHQPIRLAAKKDLEGKYSWIVDGPPVADEHTAQEKAALAKSGSPLPIRAQRDTASSASPKAKAVRPSRR